MDLRAVRMRGDRKAQVAAMAELVDHPCTTLWIFSNSARPTSSMNIRR